MEQKEYNDHPGFYIETIQNSELSLLHGIFSTDGFTAFREACFDLWFSEKDNGRDIDHYYLESVISQDTPEALRNTVFNIGYCKQDPNGKMYLLCETDSSAVIAVAQTYKVQEPYLDASILSVKPGAATNLYLKMIPDSLDDGTSTIRFIVNPENNVAIQLHKKMLKLTADSYRWEIHEGTRLSQDHYQSTLRYTVFEVSKPIEA